MRRVLFAARSGSVLGFTGLSRRANATASAGITPELRSAAALLESDPRAAELLAKALSPEARRRLIVTGGTIEFLGAQTVEETLKDMGPKISEKQLDGWFDTLKEKREALAANGAEDKPVPGRQLMTIALACGLPFVGFGFLDNATMIVTGDAIDNTVGYYFGLSVLASAALGNVCSGIMGKQIHGFIEKLITKFGITMPLLTPKQQLSQRVFLAGHIGGTVGVAFGLLLGMVPLLFVTDEDTKWEMKTFSTLDSDKNGYISVEELINAFTDLGIPNQCELATQIVDRHGADHKRLSFEDFRRVCEELRKLHKTFGSK